MRFFLLISRDTEFGYTVNFFRFRLSADFTYGDAFDFNPISSGSFENDNVSCEFYVERRRCQKKRWTNRIFWVKNVKKSCWYRYFTRPGLTREITHELSNSDRYGEFWHWFCMPLAKVEGLTNILIDLGYINPPRSHRHCVVFCMRSKFLVMSVLYLLGTGAAFCSYKPLCGISTSEVCKFFNAFIEALVNMKDKYICLPRNIT